MTADHPTDGARRTRKIGLPAWLPDYSGDPRLDAVMRHYAGVGLYDVKPTHNHNVEAEWANWPEEDEIWTENGVVEVERYGKTHLRIRATETLMAIDAAAQPRPADPRALQGIRDVVAAAHRLLEETANPQHIADEGDRRNWYALNDAYAALAALVPRDEVRSGGALVEYLWPAPANTMALRDALQRCVDTLALCDDHQEPSPAVADAVRVLCECVGYGAVMHAASYLWGESLVWSGVSGSGAFAVGPCRGSVEKVLQVARDALATGESR